MWYVAAGNPYITSRILHAWSTDDINWTKYNDGEAVMTGGGSGAWDRTIDTPEIIQDSSGYKLYYFGDSLPGGMGLNPSVQASIGLATSSDGIHWTKYENNPVLTHGNNGDWDGSWIESPAVLWDSQTGEYQMWYTGMDTTTWKTSIGLATSANGIVWTKHSGNPVIEPGPSGSYDDMWIAVPAVIKTMDQYEMWYSGLSSTTGFSNLTMNYATSHNGINWTKRSGNPLFETHTSPHSMAIDSGGPWAPDVIFDGQDYKMWYETIAGFSLATSSDQ